MSEQIDVRKNRNIKNPDEKMAAHPIKSKTDWKKQIYSEKWKGKEMMGDSENSNLWYTDSSIQSIMWD